MQEGAGVGVGGGGRGCVKMFRVRETKEERRKK